MWDFHVYFVRLAGSQEGHLPALGQMALLVVSICSFT